MLFLRVFVLDMFQGLATVHVHILYNYGAVTHDFHCMKTCMMQVCVVIRSVPVSVFQLNCLSRK